MIKIVPYQDRWPKEFEDLKEKISDAMSEDIVAIHHIGSTSVPGLAAKDVIDIQITVRSLDAPIEAALNQIGFESTDIRQDHCPPGMTLSDEELEKRYYKGKDPKINLHVRKLGCFNQEYPILFRDFLRSNAEARETYGEIKTQLSKYFPENIEAYYDIKDPVCDLIILNAIEWAKVTGWKQ
ncbi:MAG: hypothetical protein CL677_06085 [Bdellovibrionaceae bacterium]|nr:hypothetical protein [Pseudobdellovibrionaceae bacterium]|tara:strand:+ start:75209 stop:75754 length:546 start_codon:yes stop_codon:yes gene_type:complete